MTSSSYVSVIEIVKETMEEKEYDLEVRRRILRILEL
jgi:hypothetical protein